MLVSKADVFRVSTEVCLLPFRTRSSVNATYIEWEAWLIANVIRKLEIGIRKLEKRYRK